MSILYVRSDLCSLFDCLYDTTSWKQVSRNAKFFYDIHIVCSYSGMNSTPDYLFKTTIGPFLLQVWPNNWKMSCTLKGQEARIANLNYTIMIREGVLIALLTF